MLDERSPCGELAIDVTGLSYSYGNTEALNSIDLRVPRGTVLGLLGVNGSGKSTLIKLLMGLLRPTCGSVTILGRKLDRELTAIRKSVGYVSEDRYLYDWMTVAEMVKFTRAFYDNWNDRKTKSLIEAFRLREDERVKHLSKGDKVRLSMTLALGHDPDLIVLDEPTSGLDPLVRRDIMEGIVNELGISGQTVLFSSHHTDEIERVADHVAIIHQGRLLVSDELDQLKAAHRRIRVDTNTPAPDILSIPGVIAIEHHDREQVLTVNDWSERMKQLLTKLGISNPEIIPMSLEEIFIDNVSGRGRRWSA
ncbi:MAG: ATP-binding cassette domain-containing protein [Blastocatellia bacterium]